jgi:ribosomal protein S24E
LDIVLGLNEESRKAPSLTERRNNRLILRKDILMEVWSEESAFEMEKNIELIIPPELTEKLCRLLIVEDDIAGVIGYCEDTGNKISEESTGCYIGHLRQGFITYWVVYKKSGDRYEVVNAYSHRMQIV